MALCATYKHGSTQHISIYKKLVLTSVDIAMSSDLDDKAEDGLEPSITMIHLHQINTV